MTKQEADNLKITDCKIKKGRFKDEVLAKFEGQDQFLSVLSFYSDELSFNPREFMGKTEREAHQIFHDKDVAYLQS